MFKYVTGLLAVAVAAGCSDKRPETAARVRPAATPVAAADTVPGSGGIIPRAVALAQVPASLRQPGQLLEAWHWPDANGENLLVVFRGEAAAPPPPAAAASYAFNELTTGAGPAYTAQLSVRQYVRRQGAYAELWRLRDFVTNCPLRLTLRPLPGSTAITDLDHDGRSETTLIYALACRSGPASAGLKLIMREGKAKYALRGATVRPEPPAAAGPGPPTDPCCLNELSPAQRRLGEPGGYYQTEAGFRGAPPAFLPFARQHWQKFSSENN
ncbi:M949_RS01915 family surface polysaccharide biosynthesis protein [uncultured Hymenobacter sp.]|uniref:M949_RS01915 family surface polysaccharide biosynthesis protein n=1 Tax=uncultured Hymenobacter sp. TaxID=170016 RepID=UPI0035C99B40